MKSTSDLSGTAGTGVVLIGLRYHEEIREECDTIEDARALAESWIDMPTDSPSGAGWASPQRIETRSGELIEKL